MWLELQKLHIQKNKDQITINTTEAEIEEMESHHHKGTMVRSRTELIENEERPPKFFSTTEKQNQSKKKKHNQTKKQKPRIKNKR